MNVSQNDFRSGYVAMLGRPNVGKSSIINALIKEKVAAVSPKPQTTRNAVRCIYTSENSQIVFVDTPGVHKPKHALGDFMMHEISEALSQVDAVCFVVEAGNCSVGSKEQMIIDMLSPLNLPVVLAVNKIDTLPKTEFYTKTSDIYKTVMNPAAIVPISAAKSINLTLLTDAISSLLPKQPPIYPEDMIMDSTERFLAAEVIREKIFRLTDDEIPHSVAVLVEEYRTPNEFPDLHSCKIRATIVVDKAGQKGIIIGKNGAKLKSIGTAARKELENSIGFPVFLELWVKVKPGWRKSPEELRRLGYSF
jgi:GTP-binding protein Era